MLRTLVRSAIKAKLIELDAYVDDELPDYIMVMVANDRNKVNKSSCLLFSSLIYSILIKFASLHSAVEC